MLTKHISICIELIFIIKPLRGFLFLGRLISYNHLTSTRSIYFDLTIFKNRRSRLIIVEKTYSPINKKSS